jgi:flagellin-like hook-associated protein FlgL
MTVNAGSGSVTVKAPVSYSTDNTLSSLEISPGVLSPAFSPNVTSYTTTVGADCSQLVVSAVTNDSSASVSVKGTRMDPGSNTTTITVTAQDGSKKVYTIYTTKDTETTTEKATEKQTSAGESTAAETPSVDEAKAKKVTVNNIDYTIVDVSESNPLPSGYEQTDYEYNGVVVKAGKGVNTKLILMYLESSDSKGKSGFYVYDSVSKSFSVYCEVAQPDITYAILSITDSMEKPDGYTKTAYTLNGINADALVDETGRYYLFYAVSSNGVTGWFRYDSQDGTIQLYSAKADAEPVFNSVSDSSTQTAVEKGGSIWKVVSAVLAVIAVILFILLIIFVVKGSKNKRAFVAAARADEDSYEFDDDYEEDDGEFIEDDKDALEEPNEEVELLEVEETDDVR